MTKQSVKDQIDAIIAQVAKYIPEYMVRSRDSHSGDNVAICIIDEEGNVYGKLYGSDKIRNRQTYKVAWTKASQVWITGMKTEEFERKVFNGDISYKDFGIQPPDFIGWKGGQPVTLKDGTRLSIGFSGFSGITDLEIVTRAIADLNI